MTPIEILIQDKLYHADLHSNPDLKRKLQDQAEAARAELTTLTQKLAELERERERGRDLLESDETFIAHRGIQEANESHNQMGGLPTGPCQCARCAAIRAVLHPHRKAGE